MCVDTGGDYDLITSREAPTAISNIFTKCDVSLGFLKLLSYQGYWWYERCVWSFCIGKNT